MTQKFFYVLCEKLLPTVIKKNHPCKKSFLAFRKKSLLALYQQLIPREVPSGDESPFRSPSKQIFTYSLYYVYWVLKRTLANVL